jgi:HK97 family phage major capsid protein
VQRWFGGEVLDHSKKAIDPTYLDQGMAVLVDHDTGRCIGVVEDWSLGTDKVLRGVAVFDEDDPASMLIYRKVSKGQMRFTSVGYRINDLVLESQSKDAGDTYRATKWTPYEVSFVAVPADPTVGAGRSTGGAVYPVRIHSPEVPNAPQGQEQRNMSDKDNGAPTGATTEEKPATPAVTATRDNARSAGENDLREIVALAKQHGMADKIPAWINGERTVAQVRDEIMTELHARLEKGPSFRQSVTLTEKEEKEYSFRRAILSQTDGGSCFEREVSDEIGKNLPNGYKPQGGLFVLTGVRNHWDGDVNMKAVRQLMQRAGLDSVAATKGTELKFVQPGSFIDLLRNASRVIQAGATVLPGLDGPVTFPKQSGAGTFSWVGENPGADVADSNLLLGTTSLTAKTAQSTSSFSRQLLRQAVVDVEALVRADIAAIHALGIDAAALFGTGASNQPTGVFNQAGVNVVALGTNGAAPTYASMLQLLCALEQANANTVGTPAVITTPGMKYTLKNIAKLANNIAEPVWSDDDKVAGVQGFSTNQVQSNLTKGTGTLLHAVYAGIWSQLMIGEFGAMEILTDPYRLKKQGMIEVTSFQMIDIAPRYASAFSVIKDAISAF